MSPQNVKAKWLTVTGLCIITLSTVAGGYYTSWRDPRTAIAGPDASDQLTDQFKEAIEAIQESYAGQVDLERLGKYSIQGMLHQLDPHSAFFTKSEFDDVQTEQSSRIFGIGVTISRRYDRVYIMSVAPGGPGFKAGLHFGDA